MYANVGIDWLMYKYVVIFLSVVPTFTQISIDNPHLNYQTQMRYFVVEWKSWLEPMGFSKLGEGLSTSAQENERWVAA